MPPSIVFMGTPDFAVPSLRGLHQEGYAVRLVVTQPDRPKGRGRALAAPPVKLAASELGLPVQQPETVRTTEFAARLRQIDPDFLVVVAFGQILPVEILHIPRHGPINVHASLLPKYRGPAPIQWAIMRGETITGVTTMMMDQGVDTGDILASAATPIESDDTASTLHDRLAAMGATLLIKTIGGLLSGSILPQAQRHDQATYAPMLKKEHGRLRWALPSQSLDALVRAMTPWPGAFCYLGDQRLRIHRTLPLDTPHGTEPGTVVPTFPGELRVAAGKGILSILEIQAEGGKRMPVKEFLIGRPVPAGSRLT